MLPSLRRLMVVVTVVVTALLAMVSAEATPATRSTVQAGAASLSPASDIYQVPRGRHLDAVDVSCGTSRFCVAIGTTASGASGRYSVFVDHSWSAPKALPFVPRFVRCPADNACVAINYIEWSSFNGKRWSNPRAFPHRIPEPEVGRISFDCARPTFCLVYGHGEEGDPEFPPLRFDGDTWQDAPGLGVVLLSLSCGSSSCTGFGNTASGARWTRFNGSSWSAPRPVPLNFAALSCVGSRCYAVGSTHSGAWGWTVLRGSTWSTPAALRGFHELSALSCSSATRCTVVGTLRGASVGFAELAGGHWSAPVSRGFYGYGHGDDPVAISCGSSFSCAAVVGDGALLMRQGTWIRNPVFKAAVRDVSCATDSWCVAVDAWGAMRVWNGHRWSFRPRTSAFDNLLAVSCTSASFCVAVGTARTRSNLVARWDGRRWSRPAELPKMPYVGTVSCGSAAFCIALGYSGNQPGPAGTLAARFDGHRWRAIRGASTVHAGDAFDVSCTSRRYCLEIGGSSNAPSAAAYDGTHWKVVARFHSNIALPPAISCVPGTTKCLIASVNRTSAYVVHGTRVWRISSPPLGGGSISAVACSSAKRCVAVGAHSWASAGWVTNFSHWSKPFRLRTTNQRTIPITVSCGTARFCAFA